MEKQLKFTDKDLIKLILPIFAERLLNMLIGVIDTLMVSYVSEAAVSGISLVNQLNNVFIFIFGTVSSGGAVIVSQYAGKDNKENISLAASQLIMITTLISVAAMLFSIIFRKPVLSIFGKVETDIMNASATYLILSVLSFPALAIYNTNMVIFRSIGNTAVIMKISVLMNMVNVLGNAVGIFILHLDVAGVAVATFVSRTLAAAISLILAIKNNSIKVHWQRIFIWDKLMLKRIFNIAVPNGIETVLFQISKVALSSVVALFGTIQIAANAAAQNMWSLASLFCIAMGHSFAVIIGQCIGANDVKAAWYYSKRLLYITYVGSILWNTVIIVLTPFVLSLYNFSSETNRLILILVIIMNICNTILCPLDFSLSDGIRAAGDARYTMMTSLLSSAVCRILFSVLFGVALNMGIIGVVLAMICDRAIKAILISVRYKNGKWTKYKLI
ncbi:MAG: MATE family efflux transporter [Clostridiales bacterium]|nr:MATE family efflux transporter [Clostridiales bacterium]